MSISLTLPEERRNLELFDSINNSDPAKVMYSRWSTASSAEETCDSSSSQSDKSDLQDLVASILRESPTSPGNDREDQVKSLSWQQLAQRQIPKPYRTPTHSYSANRNGNPERQSIHQCSGFHRNDNFISPSKIQPPMQHNSESPNCPKYNSDMQSVRRSGSNLTPHYPAINETQLSNNEAAQTFLNSVRPRKNLEVANQVIPENSSDVDGDTFRKLIAMATDGLQEFLHNKQSVEKNDQQDRAPQPQKPDVSLSEELMKYRQTLLQNNTMSPGRLHPLQPDIYHQTVQQGNVPYPMQYHPNTPVQQQLLASQQRHIMLNTLQNSIAQEQMIQAKFRELGIGNGTPPPSQQVDWSMANQSPDILHLRSLDPSKQLNTPKKMIHPGMNNIQPVHQQSPSGGNHILSSGGKHAFQPVKLQQDSKFMFRHMDSPWSEPTTPSTDTRIASCNSVGTSAGDPYSMLSPASLDADKPGREVSPPFRPISSQGALGSPMEYDKPEEQDLGYQSGCKKSQIQSQHNICQSKLAPSVSTSTNCSSAFANLTSPAYPMSFSNGLSPYSRFTIPGNMNITRPVFCSPNSSLSYSPLPRTFVPFLTEKGWVMMPADQIGSPMPPMAKGSVMSQAEWLKMQRNVPRCKLYLCMDECFEQIKSMERERKMAEAELAQHFPGRRVSGCNNTPMPRLPANPSKADKLIVEQLREHSRVMTLIDRMEHLIEGPLHANISSCLERHYRALKDVEAKRRDELNSKHATPGSMTVHQDGDNDDITVALADSLEHLALTTRKSRTAVWCALQVTILANKVGDVDEEVALAMSAIAEKRNIAVAEAEVSCRKENRPQPCMIGIMELYKSLSSMSMQTRKI